MSTATALIAKGKAEGEARGRAEGIIIGKLQFLQKMMQLPPSSDRELAGLEVAVLELRFQELERQYQEEFKRP